MKRNRRRAREIKEEEGKKRRRINDRKRER